MLTSEQIKEADAILRSRLRLLFWRRDMDHNCQSLDDVAQECWLVMLAKQCTAKFFIWRVAKIHFLRLIERKARKREQSINVDHDDHREWAQAIEYKPQGEVVDNVDALIERVGKSYLRRTARAIATTRTIADARRELGTTKTTMQRHRMQLRDELAGSQA
ncbi:MAG: hypothetical protein WBD31_01080 [Rubripirellula sp.]